MKSIYIKFSAPTFQEKKERRNLFKRLLKIAIPYFIPVGNPIFDDKINEVKEWLIEFENGKNYPNREIGINILHDPIMIMPWRKNYGYWIDNNLLLEDFKSAFKAVEISEEEFEENWMKFRKQNDDL